MGYRLFNRFAFGLAVIGAPWVCFHAPALALDGDPLWGEIKVIQVTGPKMLESPHVVSDGNGGAWVIFTVLKTGTSPDSRFQMINLKSDGSFGKTCPQVTARYPHAVPDGAGGLFVAWVEYGTDKVFAARFDPSCGHIWKKPVHVGKLTAPPAGASPTGEPRVVPDGVGGAYVGWYDRLAHVSNNGQLSTSLNGIDPSKTGKRIVHLVADRTVGVMFEPLHPPGGWTAQELPNGSVILKPVHPGLIPWRDASAPVPLWKAKFVPGGVIVGWRDQNQDLALQRIAGGPLWGAAGKTMVVNKPGTPTDTDWQLVPDGSGGAFVVWVEPPTAATSLRILVQLLNASGAEVWSKPTAVFDASGLGGAWPTNSGQFTGSSLVVAPTGTNQMVVAWQDYRSGVPSNQSDIRARGVDGTGKAFWDATGVLVPFDYDETTPTAENKEDPPCMVSDGQGGALFAYNSSAFSKEIGYTRVLASGNKLVGKWWLIWDDKQDSTGQVQIGLNQQLVGMAFDGSGPLPRGAILLWYEFDGQSHHRLFAEKVTVE